MLELAILGLLQDQELHGYELKKRLAETLGPFAGASFGSLYPALRRLESTGAVRAVSVREPVTRVRRTGSAVPMTGSLGGELAAFAARRHRLAAAISDSVEGAGRRNRKVYAITDRGRQLFAELLAAEPSASGDDRTFTVKLAFAGHLPAHDRLGLLERQRAQLVERLGRIRTTLRSAGDALDRYRRSVIEHSLHSTEREISWLDRLIEEEALHHAGASEGNTK